MEPKNMLELVVGIAVGILVLSAALFPVIDTATATEGTFENDGYFRVSKISSDEEHTITWDYADPYTFTIDNEDHVELPFGSTNAPIFPYSIISTDSWALRFISTNTGTQIDLAVFGQNSNLMWGASTAGEESATFTFSNGTASITKTGQAAPLTLSYSSAFIPDSDGAYIMKKSNESAYLNGDSEIYSTGRTGGVFGGSTVNLNLNVQATIDDGATIAFIYPTSGYSASNEAVNNTAVNGYLDLYKFSNVTFTITDGDENTYDANYGQVIVPYKVTAELAVHASEDEIEILETIPLLIIVGLIMGIVGLIASRRFE